MSAATAERTINQTFDLPRRGGADKANLGNTLGRIALVARRLLPIERRHVEKTNAVMALTDPEQIRRALSPSQSVDDTRWRLVAQMHGARYR